MTHLPNSTAAGAALAILLSSCALRNRASTSDLHDPNNLARELVPAGSVVTANPAHLIEAWSARTTYTFEAQGDPANYHSWAKQQLGAEWHCRGETGGTIVFRRLLPTEQQLLDIELEVAGPGKIRVRVTITAIPT